MRRLGSGGEMAARAVAVVRGDTRFAEALVEERKTGLILYRLVEPSATLRQRIVEAVGARSEVAFILDLPYMRFQTVPGIPTMTASFTTDIPSLTNWGQPLLFGPGSILVAHTDREFISKRELHAAVGHYESIARQLING